MLKIMNKKNSTMFFFLQNRIFVWLFLVAVILFESPKMGIRDGGKLGVGGGIWLEG